MVIKMEIIAATKNKGKVAELKSILSVYGFDVISQDEAGIEAEVCESGSTFLENALIKARAVALLCDCAVIADDSGICVNALGGEPGIYSARYSGVHGDSEANNRKLLAELSDKNNRSAYFECAVALVLPDGEELTAGGRTEGRILEAPSGENGFGYDCIFYSDELGKSFGVASDEEKNAVSHRAKALKNLCCKLDRYLK